MLLSACTSDFCLSISCLLLSHCLHCQPFFPYFPPNARLKILPFCFPQLGLSTLAIPVPWFPRPLKTVCEGYWCTAWSCKQQCSSVPVRCKGTVEIETGGKKSAVLIPPIWNKTLSWKLSFRTYSLPNFLASMLFLPHSSMRNWKGQNQKQHEMGVRLVKTMKQNE